MTARIERPVADVITYIPPDAVRQLTRARHPAQALAHELASRWGLECRPLLERKRVAGRQATLPLAERRGNMRNVFAATRAAHGRVLLVDDVYTSGSTAGAAASALRGSGTARVEVLTFVRALR